MTWQTTSIPVMLALFCALLAPPVHAAEVTGGQVTFHVDAELKSADFVCPAVGAGG